MKKTILMLTMAAFVAGTATLTACSSPAEKEAKAEEHVQDAKQDLVAAQQNATQASINAANAEEWQAFKNETNAKIDANQSMISELRKMKRKADNDMTEAAYKAKIDELQERNKLLRERMDAYETNKSDWATFKSKFNSDMDDLGRSLKDIGNRK